VCVCVCVHLLTVIYQRRQIRDKPETKPVSFSATLDPLITLSLATVKKKKTTTIKKKKGKTVGHHNQRCNNNALINTSPTYSHM